MDWKCEEIVRGKTVKGNFGMVSEGKKLNGKTQKEMDGRSKWEFGWKRFEESDQNGGNWSSNPRLRSPKKERFLVVQYEVGGANCFVDTILVDEMAL